MRIGFKTFGCKANSVDTDSLTAEAIRRGYEVVSDEEKADFYVINSCTVTANADRDARVQVSRFKRLSPGALVGVVGCYAQVAKEQLLNLPEVDFVVGTADKFEILNHFAEARAGQSLPRDQVKPARGFLPESFRGSRYSRASLKVQDGCNFKCSFCIIPEARGRSRSLPLEAVVNQAKEAAAQGFNEVVLTAIHLAHYGWDCGTDLLTLVRAILDLDGPRVRLSTLDPFEIPDELIALLDHPKFCPHFHIALQSGSDKILERMRRIHRTGEFQEVTRKIVARRPETFIGVDVIVGFPGEGEAEFAETRSTLEESPWTKLHVFSFSAREGTRAAELDAQVDGATIASRSQTLRALSDERYRGFLSSEVGKARHVVLERPAGEPNVWLGHTENYLPTYSLVADGVSKAVLPSLIRRVDGQRVWTSPTI